MRENTPRWGGLGNEEQGLWVRGSILIVKKKEWEKYANRGLSEGGGVLNSEKDLRKLAGRDMGKKKLGRLWWVHRREVRCLRCRNILEEKMEIHWE